MSMDVRILVTRLVAAANRGGATDGAVLAADYNAAVGEVTARLESALAAIQGDQPGEALRILEDEPRVLDVVSALEFAQFEDWEALCADEGWPAPERIEQTLLDRVLLFVEGRDVVEPLLKMYRRAMRAHDVRLAVRVLRQLAERDTSQDWTADLVAAEAEWQKSLLGEFNAARQARKDENALHVARVLFEEPWHDAVQGTAYLEARAVYDAARREERLARISDLICALAGCWTDAWSRLRAKSLVSGLEQECVEGVVLSADQRELVARCRARWEEEDAAEAAEQEARRAAAERALRKKWIIRVSASVAAALVIAVTGTGVYVVRTAHERGCRGEIVRLENMLSGGNPIGNLETEIQRVQRDYPEIWADARVAVYADKLETLRFDWCVRTNAIAVALARLEALRDEAWPETREGVARTALDEVAQKIRAEDAFAQARFTRLREAFSEVVQKRQADRANRAEALGTTMMAQIRMVSERLAHEFATTGLTEQVSAVKKTMREWEELYASNKVQSAEDFAQVRDAFLVHEKRQAEAQQALDALRAADDLAALEKARARLVTDFADYGAVKGWRPVWANAERVASLFSSSMPAMKRFHAAFATEVPEEEYKTFLEDLRGLKELDALYALHGVRETCQSWYNVIAKGRPIVTPVTRGGQLAYRIRGTLLMARKLEVRDEYEWKLSKQWETKVLPSVKTKKGVTIKGGERRVPVKLVEPVELLPPSHEIRDVYNFVVDNEKLKQSELAAFILEQLEKHLACASSNVWIAAERKEQKVPHLKPGRYSAYAHVQMIDRYIGRLQALNHYAESAPCARKARDCARLAKPVHVERIEDAITWTCTSSEDVRKRNEECVAFLETFPTNFTAQVRAWNRVRGALAKHLERFSVRFAGKVIQDAVQFADSPDHVWLEANETGREAPLYVLREGKVPGSTVLKRAFDVMGTGWRRAVLMPAKDLIPGEPLFCVKDLSATVAPEDVIRQVLEGVDAETARRFVAKIPFVEL